MVIDKVCQCPGQEEAIRIATALARLKESARVKG